MQTPAKMRAVRETMARRFHSGAGKECMAILDRLRFVCNADPVPALRVHHGFHPGRSVFPRRRNPAWLRPYQRGLSAHASNTPLMGPYAKWVAGFLDISDKAFSLIEHLKRPEFSDYDSLACRTFFDLSVMPKLRAFLCALRYRTVLECRHSRWR